MCQNEYTAAECHFYSAHSSLLMISYPVDKKWCFVGSAIFLKRTLHWGQGRLNNQNMGDGKHLQSTSPLCSGGHKKLQGKPLSKKVALNCLQRLSSQVGPVHRKRWGCKSHLVLLNLNLRCPVLLCLLVVDTCHPVALPPSPLDLTAPCHLLELLLWLMANSCQLKWAEFA